MELLRNALTPQTINEILTRPDTLPENLDTPLGQAGLTHANQQLLLSCKAPFWLGWTCWLFKK